MSDIRLFETPDGGEIKIANGQIGMTDGLETAAILSLFGGNAQDSAQTADDTEQWWGNLSETDQSRRFRSAAQYLLATLPLIPANLQRIEEAALSDLAWMTDSVATDLAVRATMPGPKRINLDVALTIDGVTTSFSIAKLTYK
jgi:phage gp46-like protein